MVAQIDSTYRQYGLKKTLRRLVSYGAFEGRPLTTRGRWINPVVFRFLKGLAQFPGQPQLRAPIFITGLGRSGTTILGVLLSVHQDVAFLNEPKAMWHLIDPSQDLNANYSDTGGCYELDPASIDADTRRRAHRLFRRYAGLVGAKRVVDKYPELIFRVDYVRTLFPDARIVFITRRGPDAVPSVVKWSERLGVSDGDCRDDWWGRNDVKWAYLCEQVLMRYPRYASVRKHATPALDQENRAALEWIVTMDRGLQEMQAHPELVHRISYEDLLADTDHALAALLDFCGLDHDASVFQYAKTRLHDNPAKPWPNLLPEVHALFAETMANLGYHNEPSRPL
ncbi:sulfotransferase [Nitrogeniibacter mangrovi]|uniref:Sulfotransferase n=1 Tax=Nitrogeniibacter mangrovi TaxID=2016596 RepID=A0A6C1B1S7_9RHOO|nr:sulfotransferase [Nitrogeniibacter mangrovi]QID16768.1 sulfotransferase [Nitrogeniibacter mangrovi]